MTETPQAEEKRDLLPVPLDQPLSGLDEAWRLASAIARADLLPRDLHGKPTDVMAVMLYGRDLALTPMQAIQGIYVVRGKPQLAAQTWTALVRRAGHKIRLIESTNERATVQIVLKDDPDYPVTETFTIDDAIKAGLCTRNSDGEIRARSSKGEVLPWESYTRTMLRNRAMSNAGKIACPEVAMGMALEGDWDYIPEAPEVTVEQPSMHRQEMSQADLAAEVKRAAAEFGQGDPVSDPGDPAAPDEDIVDGEVVEDQPAPAPEPETPTAKGARARAKARDSQRSEPTPDEAPGDGDPEADLFARADEQAEQAMRDREDGDG